MHKLTPEWYQPRPDLKKIDNITKTIGTQINNIKIIDHFLTDKECEMAMSIINRTPINYEATHSYPIHNYEKYFGEDDLEKTFTNMMAPRLVKVAELLYNLPLIKDQKFLYVVHPAGTYIDPHTDILDIDNPDYKNDTLDDQIKQFPFLWSGHLSILGYLNDDYDGGELYFPELDYAIKPKKGMLVTFPGSLHYVHGVAKVTNGTRYTISQWSKIANFKSTEN